MDKLRDMMDFRKEAREHPAKQPGKMKIDGLLFLPCRNANHKELEVLLEHVVDELDLDHEGCQAI